jgi:trimeric autotransporter adhesin
MNSSVSIYLVVLVMLANLFPRGAVQAAPSAERSLSSAPMAAETAPAALPDTLLQPDGSLKLDGSFHGTLDLSGWDVRLDAERGPLLSTPASLQLASQQWSGLGGGGTALNGSVNAFLVDGSSVYLAGSFSAADGLPGADSLVRWDGTQWSEVSPGFKINGPVNAIAKIGTTLYIGGQFQSISSISGPLACTQYIARWNGSTWQGLGTCDPASFKYPLSGFVNALAVIGSDLYVGGQFGQVHNNGVFVPGAAFVARYDGSSWHALGGSSTPAIEQIVLCLAVVGSNLYIGGVFFNAKNNGVELKAADYIVGWNSLTNTFFALDHDGSGNGSLNGPVHALSADGTGNLYVGGAFTNVNVSSILDVLPSADYIARWSGSAWVAVGSNGSGNGSLNATVYSLLASGGKLYAGGYFTDVNNKGTVLNNADYLARFDGSNWSAMGSGPAGSGPIGIGVGALAMVGTTLYAGGVFQKVFNNGVQIPDAAFAARWNGTEWSALTGQPNGVMSQDASVFAIAVDGNDVYVGGNFQDLRVQNGILTAADFVAKWDGTSWSALGSNGAGDGALTNIVQSLAIYNGDLYIGGAFETTSNQGSDLKGGAFLVRWNGSTYSPVKGDGIAGSSVKGHVYALKVIASKLYVGGAFLDVSNGGNVLTAADYLAVWDGTNWAAVGSDGSGNGSLKATVTTIESAGSNVYVGGFFTNVNNHGTVLAAADYIARWDGSNWHALGEGSVSNGVLNSIVYSIAINGNDLYAGGMFQNIDNRGVILSAADFVARFDGSNWHALGSDGAGDGALKPRYGYGMPSVEKILFHNGQLYVGGNFYNVHDGAAQLKNADFIARWDGSRWQGLNGSGSDRSPLNDIVHTMLVSGDDLYVGGDFFDAADSSAVRPTADKIAVYRLPQNKVFMPFLER